MKTTFFSILFVLGFVGFTNLMAQTHPNPSKTNTPAATPATGPKAVVKNNLDLAKVTCHYSVSGMTSANDENLVKLLFMQMGGVASAVITYRDQTGVVTFDPAKTSCDAIYKGFKSTKYHLKVTNTVTPSPAGHPLPSKN